MMRRSTQSQRHCHWVSPSHDCISTVSSRASLSLSLTKSRLYLDCLKPSDAVTESHQVSTVSRLSQAERRWQLHVRGRDTDEAYCTHNDCLCWSVYIYNFVNEIGCVCQLRQSGLLCRRVIIWTVMYYAVILQCRAPAGEHSPSVLSVRLSVFLPVRACVFNCLSNAMQCMGRI